MDNHQVETRTEDPASIVRSRIDAVGWAVIHVPDGQGNPLRKPFSYTMGFEETFGHPEVVLVGLTPPAGHGILNIVGRRLRSGMRFDDWSTDDGILPKHPVWFRALDPARSAASIHFLLPQHPDARALHLLLPDDNGLFPWDAGTDARFATQPQGMRYLTTGFHS